MGGAAGRKVIVGQPGRTLSAYKVLKRSCACSASATEGWATLRPRRDWVVVENLREEGSGFKRAEGDERRRRQVSEVEGCESGDGCSVSDRNSIVVIVGCCQSVRRRSSRHNGQWVMYDWPLSVGSMRPGVNNSASSTKVVCGKVDFKNE